MADIFISYKKEERKLAQNLAAKFEKKGWSVWWDHKLLGGNPYDKQIQQELTAAKVVIVIWSKLSVESDFVRDEARAAQGRGVLIPVSFDNTKAPLGFGMMQVVYLTGTVIGSNDYKKLYDSIENKMGGLVKDSAGDPPTGISKPIVVAGVILLALLVGGIAYYIKGKNTPPKNISNKALKIKAGQVNQMIIFNRYDDILPIMNPITKATLTRQVFQAGVDTVNHRYNNFQRPIDTIFVKDLPFDYYQIRNQYQNGVNTNKIIFDQEKRVYGIFVE
ncbi:toll/interleukin-1 receptor domain-containing protein [Agriterribacter humi]|uniref:toll/interleukin-1 receptor domain-containing protein n=1 Tax=Agriterribacter humi TaxID=1104781 RepID=UPI00186B0B50|nr:toll/interleukin-1 receptor domain-containing protein [Agriterribacter humi]